MIQKPLKVLLIEDNPDDVVLLRHYLAKIPLGPDGNRTCRTAGRGPETPE